MMKDDITEMLQLTCFFSKKKKIATMNHKV